MSENKNIQNEDELWDLLSEPVTTETKADKPKAEPKPKFMKPEPKAAPAPKAEPVVKPEPAAKPEPAVKPEPAAKPEPAVKAEAPKSAVKAEAPKSARKIDGFFVACMAGVAAVSVAATLLLGGMLGGNSSAGGDQPIFGGADAPDSGYSAELEQQNSDLKLENAELRAQLDQQKQQIKDLQADLLTLMGSEDYLASASTDPNAENEVQDAQVKALETFAAIQEAYADFDREKLEELIPQMDEQLSYLTPEMLNNYYLILEYVEQPSNG